MRSIFPSQGDSHVLPHHGCWMASDVVVLRPDPIGHTSPRQLCTVGLPSATAMCSRRMCRHVLSLTLLDLGLLSPHGHDDHPHRAVRRIRTDGPRLWGASPPLSPFHVRYQPYALSIASWRRLLMRMTCIISVTAIRSHPCASCRARLCPVRCHRLLPRLISPGCPAVPRIIWGCQCIPRRRHRLIPRRNREIHMALFLIGTAESSGGWIWCIR